MEDDEDERGEEEDGFIDDDSYDAHQADFDAQVREAELGMPEAELLVNNVGIAEVELLVDDGGMVIDAAENADVLNVPDTPVLREHYSGVEDRTITDHDTLLDMIDELYQKWVKFPEAHTRAWERVAFLLYGMEDPAHPVHSRNDLLRLELGELRRVSVVLQRAVDCKLIPSFSTECDMSQMCVRVAEMVANAASAVRAKMCMFETVEAGRSGSAYDSQRVWNARLRMVSDPKDEDLLPFQRTVLHVLRVAHERNLRRYRGHMYSQKIVAAPVGARVSAFYTRAWEKQMDFIAFVYSAICKVKDFEAWKDFTSHGQVPMSVARYLENTHTDSEVPVLVPDRHTFSFRNGVYCAAENRFYTYDVVVGGVGGIPPDLVSAKYFDVEMDMDACAAADFRSINTPALDSIFQTQKISTELHVPPKFPNAAAFSVRDWFYAFMGRMIYEIGVRDSWQAIMFIKGQAGTGKSTLGRVMHNLYNSEDVGVLSNNVEKKFGLSAVYDKLIWMSYEVKKDWGLEQGDMQSIISGEAVSIATKNKTAATVKWSSHGFLLGNELPDWTDNSGSMSRRVVLSLFDEIVTEGNPLLDVELKAEMGNIIVKINRAYMEVSTAFGGVDIWNALPPYFRNNARQLSAGSHVLANFLEYSPDLQFGPSFFMLERDFQSRLTTHITTRMNVKAAFSFNPDFYGRTFVNYHLLVNECELEYEGQITVQRFVVGVCLKSHVNEIRDERKLERVVAAAKAGVSEAEW